MDFSELRRKAEGNMGLRGAADSPEARRLMGTLDTAAVERAARTGDTAALKAVLEQVLSTPEGKALAARVRKVAEQNG